MWPVSCRIPRCGRLTRDRCRRRNGLAAGDDQCAFVATTSIPISVEELALSLPKRSWRRIKWREGTAEPLSSRFARARVRVADRDYALTEGPPQEWLMIEWPEGGKSRPNIGFRPSRETSPGRFQKWLRLAWFCDSLSLSRQGIGSPTSRLLRSRTSTVFPCLWPAG